MKNITCCTRGGGVLKCAVFSNLKNSRRIFDINRYLILSNISVLKYILYYFSYLFFRILVVEAWTDRNNTMAYYGTKEYAIAHFPFNFGLILLRTFQDAVSIFNFVNDWTINLPETGVPNWVVSVHVFMFIDLSNVKNIQLQQLISHVFSGRKSRYSSHFN